MESKAAQQYVSRVRRRLTCSAPSRKRLSLRSQELADQFAAENPNARYDDFVTAFGPPENFAGELLSSLDGGEVKAARRRRGLSRRITLIGLILVLCIGGCLGWVKWSQYARYQEMFKSIRDADFVIVRHGPYEITDEEYYAIQEEAIKETSTSGG